MMITLRCGLRADPVSGRPHGRALPASSRFAYRGRRLHLRRGRAYVSSAMSSSKLWKNEHASGWFVKQVDRPRLRGAIRPYASGACSAVRRVAACFRLRAWRGSPSHDRRRADVHVVAPGLAPGEDRAAFRGARESGEREPRPVSAIRKQVEEKHEIPEFDHRSGSPCRKRRLRGNDQVAPVQGKQSASFRIRAAAGRPRQMSITGILRPSLPPPLLGPGLLPRRGSSSRRPHPRQEIPIDVDPGSSKR